MKVAFLTTRLSEIRGGGILLCNYAKALSRYSRVDAEIYSIESPQADQSMLREALDKDTLTRVEFIMLPKGEKRESRFFRTARYLKSLGWDIRDTGIRDITHLRRLRRGGGKYLPRLPYFKKLLLEHFNEYDILHIGAWNTLYTFVASKMKSTLPYKTVLHSIYHEAPTGTENWRACQRILSNTDAVTTSTPWEEKFFREQGLSDVYYVGEGVDVEYIEKETAKMQIEEDVFTILFIGARNYGKGYYHALLAVNELAKKVSYNKIRMIVIGRGNMIGAPSSLRDEVAEAYASLRKHESVEDYVFLSEREKLRHLKRAHVVLLPSKAETIPLVTLEGWALKKPSILGDIPTVRSFLEQDGGGAVLVDFADVQGIAQNLESFYANRDLLNAIGSRGHAILLKIGTLKYVSNRLASVYERILSEKN